MKYTNSIVKPQEVMEVLRVSAKRIKLNFYENHEVSPESLWIGGSRREVLALAGWMEKLG